MLAIKTQIQILKKALKIIAFFITISEKHNCSQHLDNFLRHRDLREQLESLEMLKSDRLRQEAETVLKMLKQRNSSTFREMDDGDFL
jgi:riboflavin synthase